MTDLIEWLTHLMETVGKIVVTLPFIQSTNGTPVQPQFPSPTTISSYTNAASASAQTSSYSGTVSVTVNSGGQHTETIRKSENGTTVIQSITTGDANASATQTQGQTGNTINVEANTRGNEL